MSETLDEIIEESDESETRAIDVYIPRGITVPAEKRRQVVLARKALSWRQRVFLDFLIEHHFHARNATRAMNAYRGHFVHPRTVYKWLNSTKFYDVVKLIRSFDIRRQEATDSDRILMDHRKIADYGLDTIEVKNEKTGKVSQKMRNAAIALQALDKLGKNKKLWGTEEQVARVVVDIVDLTGPQQREVIDVTPEKVDGGSK